MRDDHNTQFICFSWCHKIVIKVLIVLIIYGPLVSVLIYFRQYKYNPFREVENTNSYIANIAAIKRKKSPTKLNAAENKFDIGDLFTNGENYRGKISSDEFKVTTPENPLLSKQAVTSKRNLNI